MRHGFLFIDKPLGPTSHDVVHTVRKTLNERDIGHIGTLDPAASGLLVLAVGSKALKVIEFFQHLTKEYEAEITFGSVSSTYDREGVIETFTMKPGWIEPDQLQIRRLIQERFIGNIQQKPPAHSAIHIAGKRAYDLARKGVDIQMQARTVNIDACDIIRFIYPMLTLRIHCGSGTYIRSLAHDLGDMLRCGAYLSALHRTKVGEWSVDSAVSPEKINWTNVVPIKDILRTHAGIEISANEWEEIRHGRTVDRVIEGDVFAWHEGLPVAVLTNVGGKGRARKVL